MHDSWSSLLVCGSALYFGRKWEKQTWLSASDSAWSHMRCDRVLTVNVLDHSIALSANTGTFLLFKCLHIFSNILLIIAACDKAAVTCFSAFNVLGEQHQRMPTTIHYSLGWLFIVLYVDLLASCDAIDVLISMCVWGCFPLGFAWVMDPDSM